MSSFNSITWWQLRNKVNNFNLTEKRKKQTQSEARSEVKNYKKQSVYLLLSLTELCTVLKTLNTEINQLRALKHLHQHPGGIHHCYRRPSQGAFPSNSCIPCGQPAPLPAVTQDLPWCCCYGLVSWLSLWLWYGNGCTEVMIQTICH